MYMISIRHFINNVLFIIGARCCKKGFQIQGIQTAVTMLTVKNINHLSLFMHSQIYTVICRLSFLCACVQTPYLSQGKGSGEFLVHAQEFNCVCQSDHSSRSSVVMSALLAVGTYPIILIKNFNYRLDFEAKGF